MQGQTVASSEAAAYFEDIENRRHQVKRAFSHLMNEDFRNNENKENEILEESIKTGINEKIVKSRKFVTNTIPNKDLAKHLQDAKNQIIPYDELDKLGLNEQEARHINESFLISAVNNLKQSKSANEFLETDEIVESINAVLKTCEYYKENTELQEGLNKSFKYSGLKPIKEITEAVDVTPYNDGEVGYLARIASLALPIRLKNIMARYCTTPLVMQSGNIAKLYRLTRNATKAKTNAYTKDEAIYYNVKPQYFSSARRGVNIRTAAAAAGTDDVEYNEPNDNPITRGTIKIYVNGEFQAKDSPAAGGKTSQITLKSGDTSLPMTLTVNYDPETTLTDTGDITLDPGTKSIPTNTKIDIDYEVNYDKYKTYINSIKLQVESFEVGLIELRNYTELSKLAGFKANQEYGINASEISNNELLSLGIAAQDREILEFIKSYSQAVSTGHTFNAATSNNIARVDKIREVPAWLLGVVTEMVGEFKYDYSKVAFVGGNNWAKLFSELNSGMDYKGSGVNYFNSLGQPYYLGTFSGLNIIINPDFGANDGYITLVGRNAGACGLYYGNKLLPHIVRTVPYDEGLTQKGVLLGQYGSGIHPDTEISQKTLQKVALSNFGN